MTGRFPYARMLVCPPGCTFAHPSCEIPLFEVAVIPPRPGSRHLIIPRSASRAAPSIGAKGVAPSRDWPCRKRRVCHSAAQKRLFSVRAGIVSPPAPACGLPRCAYSFLIRNKEVRILTVTPFPYQVPMQSRYICTYWDPENQRVGPDPPLFAPTGLPRGKCCASQ